MAQRIDYAFFPGVRDELLWPTVNKVLGHIHRTELTPRDLRDWLKDAGLWQKDEAPALLALLDVQQTATVQLGPWASLLFAAKDDAAARDLLFKRLCDENVLLCKYVLEALDVDGGGRLHSTSELHRMLTSYVYPGKHVGRVAFEAWIKWMVASGRVRLIGIRWGLSDLGKLAVPRLRTVDADEFLEDEAAPGAAPAVAPVAVAAPVRAPAPVPVAALTDDEEMPDAPPEAEPVDAQTFAAYEARLAEPEPPPPVAKPKTQPAMRQATPVVAKLAAVHGAPGACSQAPLDVAEIVATLRAVGKQRGLDGGSLLLAHGLEPRMAQNDAARHLFLAALLARLCLQPDGDVLATLLHERAGGWGPVALLLDRPEALLECLTRWGLAGSDGPGVRLRALLLDATLGGRALKAHPDLPTVLAESVSAEQLLTTLGQGLMRAATLPEQFWLVREMVKAGLWTRPAATEVAFVPTRPVRLMAYRLRLLDSHFAQSLPLYLAVARRLAALLPAGSVEEAALEALAPDDHLRFDCPRVIVCQTSCAVTAQRPD